ncbi:MAG: ABC transporter permease [Bacteroidota bacterium]|nr:FtsX-like permease family protein [Ignavibacteria bacterium]HEX2961089.1 ABC transporter permease [Ignavibacteriales bacterium]MCU7498973.1 FtsX-like permease family protein [Ignavibacteria bacterium]MCU7512452.1 FtsX-like permease family protein [Ignavibacteria bacterium]MCU7518577.1 FtsX-like permease family protein [Ignavibacteria bacterium]
MVQIYESIIMALNSLRSNKTRSILTLVGIAIGLFSIIIVMTAISAIQGTFEDAFNDIGTNNIIVQKYPAIQTGHGAWMKYRNRKDLTVEQGEKLKEMTNLPVAVGISLGQGSRMVKYNKEATNPNVYMVGVNNDEFTTSSYVIDDGRGFSRQDMLYARNVCVIGNDIVKKLFKSIDPIGQKVTVDNMRLEVIGRFKEKGSVLGQSQDNFLIIPISVFTKYYGDRSSAEFNIQAPDNKRYQATMDQVIGALRTIRKVSPGEENDFEIVTNSQLISQFNDITKYFRVGAGVVAFIALVAAGIGIMNIMLVSVTERTREIGIRKAIGAQKNTIRFQFLAEATVLSLLGGISGIILGLIGGNIIAVLLKASVVVPVFWIAVGLIVTSAVGLVFGVYPAIKASNLDPIEALRYE